MEVRHARTRATAYQRPNLAFGVGSSHNLRIPVRRNVAEMAPRTSVGVFGGIDACWRDCGV